MYLFHLFRSFLPLRNPIGFGASDFIEIAVTALLVLLALGRPAWEPAARKLAIRTVPCMLFLAGLAIALRVALLPVCPVPAPSGADDFSYLLLADTLAHFRLANPPHPLHRFFETNFVLQRPSYSSIYPLGPALVLAFGQIVFHLPWAGVVLSVATFCALCYWMLSAWTTPGWAFVGGLLAICAFGPLEYWMNCYWGGAVSAIAGCLVFGSLPRLRESGRARDAALLGLGLGAQMLSRPWESIFLDFSVVFFLARDSRRLGRVLFVALLPVLAAGALILAHDKAVTGSFTMLPYQLSRFEYGVPSTFTFEANPVPHAQLTPDQRLYYEGQAAAHGDAPETVARYLSRFGRRLPVYSFFVLVPLYVAAPFFLLSLKEFRFLWAAVTLVIFALGANFYPYLFPHYVAAVTCLFVLICITGLQRMGITTSAVTSSRRFRLSTGAGLAEENGTALPARWILYLCAVHFLFWYGLFAIGDEEILRGMTPYNGHVNINRDDPEGRIAVNTELARSPEKQLVFVRYSGQHDYHEWIHNAANIDSAPVIWAVDRGPEEDATLTRAYPDRRTWLLQPDAKPPAPKLTRWSPGSGTVPELPPDVSPFEAPPAGETVPNQRP